MLFDGDMELNEKIIKLGELNEIAYEDPILSIKNTHSSVGKVAFGLVQKLSAYFLEGNCKIAWTGVRISLAP